MDTSVSPYTKLSTDIQVVIRDVEELLSAIANDTSEKATQLRANLTARLASLKASVPEYQAKAAEQVRRAATAANGVVTEHPWKSVGVAASLGLMVGLLLNSRR